ncbi:hypothetical protein [Streptomyces sp. H27-D2]|uniref:hypothetical protein n=1 Tax=Streptomyces sp. H27-D2 TaxID=3046304 RepID=UPI002DBC0897|nr:hypothetical protein [Streptomyces sp. H27-D2]MEC4016026.1 hypothetical protein [Streptomyces sp. H27-D2]
MTTPPHPGRRRCYLDGCDQDACREAHLRYCKRYNYDAAHNGRRTTDVTPYAVKLQTYVDAGWSKQGLADATGVARTTVRDILCGDVSNLYPETARRLDAFQPAPGTPPTAAWTDLTGTRRRIQALAVTGWPLWTTAADLGMGLSSVRRIVNESWQQTSKQTAQAVDGFYTRRSRIPGPSNLARLRALGRGWHGPLAWDDNLDDPDARPDIGEPAVELNRLQLGRYRRAEIDHLDKFGIPYTEIAERLGMDENPNHVRDIVGELRKERVANPAIHTQAAA